MYIVRTDDISITRVNDKILLCYTVQDEAKVQVRGSHGLSHRYGLHLMDP